MGKWARICEGVRRLRERCAGRRRDAGGSAVAVGPIVAAGGASEIRFWRGEHDMVQAAEQLAGRSAVAECSNHDMCIEFGFRCPAAAPEGYTYIGQGGAYTVGLDFATVGGGQGLRFYRQEYPNFTFQYVTTPEQQLYGQGLPAVWRNAPNTGDGGLAAMQQQYNGLVNQQLHAQRYTISPAQWQYIMGTDVATFNINLPPSLPDEGDAGA